MAEKNVKTRVQHKHDVEANWNLATGFVPLAGELIVYDEDSTHDYKRLKIGDGSTVVGALNFVAYSIEEIDGLLAQKSQVQIITWEAND